MNLGSKLKSNLMDGKDGLELNLSYKSNLFNISIDFYTEQTESKLKVPDYYAA